MEKKIERVPYISKWYKEELDWSQLFKFDFKDEPMTEETAKRLNNCFKETMDYLNNAGSDYDIDKAVIDWKNKTTTTISCPNGIHFWSPQEPQLKYVCNLTEEELTELSIRLLTIRQLICAIKAFPKRKDFKAHCDCIEKLAMEIRKYLFNEDNIRDKAQERMLKILEEQAKSKKSYEENVYKLTKKDVDCISNKIKSMLDILSDITIPTDKYKEMLKLMVDIPNMVYKKSCEKCED